MVKEKNSNYHTPMNTPLLTPLLTLLLLLTACGHVSDNSVEVPVEESASSSVAKPVPNTPPVADCGQKNAECASSDDCCGSAGLTCQEVRTSDGGFGKRCLPVEQMVCKTDCKDGVWSGTRACKTTVPPAGYTRCEDMVGESCNADGEGRMSSECIDS